MPSDGILDDHTTSKRDVLTPMFRRSMFWRPERQAPSAWLEHVPFAFWLVDVLRPRTVVELGTHYGVSYSAICQAVKGLSLATSCYAVDTWEGDLHAGFYGEDVYYDFAAFHDQRYGAFSRLVRSTFDEALRHFENGSIDLLHIDGLHTYEAVRHDYESWLPKLSPSALILFHDTNVRENNFGVFQLWREVTCGQLHFEFLHGHGLGVLGLSRSYSSALRLLFDANEDSRASIREIFASLGHSLSIAERNSEIGVLRHSLAELEASLAIERQRARELEQEAAARVQHEQELLALKAAARVQHEQELLALKASMSWRVTAPLRSARRLVCQFWRAVRSPSRAPLRDRRDARVVAGSYYFDGTWYLANNPDVAEAGIDPALHYASRGWREGRNPGPAFDTQDYLTHNPDVERSGANPLVHYVKRGAIEARAGGVLRSAIGCEQPR
jgi:hypothetical protein